MSFHFSCTIENSDNTGPTFSPGTTPLGVSCMLYLATASTWAASFPYCWLLWASEFVVSVARLTLASFQFHLSEYLHLKSICSPWLSSVPHNYFLRISPALTLPLPLVSCTQSALSYIDYVFLLLPTNCEHLKGRGHLCI